MIEAVHRAALVGAEQTAAAREVVMASSGNLHDLYEGLGAVGDDFFGAMTKGQG